MSGFAATVAGNQANGHGEDEEQEEEAAEKLQEQNAFPEAGPGNKGAATELAGLPEGQGLQEKGQPPYP